jgi:hypothetical protein
MTFNFTEGEPVAAAVQFGNRAFTAATPQNGKLVFTLPPGIAASAVTEYQGSKGETGKGKTMPQLQLLIFPGA